MKAKDLKLTFQMERRSFLKWSALAGAAGMVMNFDEAMAAGECATMPDLMAPASVAATLSKLGLVEKDLSEEQKLSASTLNKDFFYWFDGPMIEGQEVGPKFRGRLSMFLDRRIDATQFLEAVFLSDSSRNILDERRFDATSAGSTRTGKPPYIVLDNVELAKADHYIYFVISKVDGSSVVVYRYQIMAADVRQSRFDYAHLATETKEKIPQIFRDEMKEAGHGLSEENYGIVTTPYQFFADLPTHIVRAHFAYVNNDNFEVYIEPMHGDVDVKHYMRYFAVLDPVGRFLGVKRRKWDPADAAHAGTDSVLMDGRRYYKVTATYTAGGEAAIDELWAGKINTADANIGDCPFVQIVTEDGRDAIARVSVRLR